MSKFYTVLESLHQRVIKFDELAEDIQQLITDIWYTLRDDTIPPYFKVKRLPISSFPKYTWDDDRGIKHAEEMTSIDPIIISNGVWVDGRHRLHKAKMDGKEYIDTIDLGLDWGETNYSPNLGKLQ